MSRKSGPARGPVQTGIADVVPWSVPVTLDQIPDNGLHRAIEAPEEARAAIATLAGLRDVPALSAVFDVEKRGPRVFVKGRVQGRLGQTCVVSLEPMETMVDEAVDLIFAPPPAGAVLAEDDSRASRRRNPDRDFDTIPEQGSDEGADDATEPLTGNSIDLGAIASEFLVLAIDPYPRKEGAEFTPPAVAETRENPFAALAALKKEPGNRNN